MQQEQKIRATGDPFWAEIVRAGMEKHAETITQNYAYMSIKGTLTPQRASVNLKRAVWPDHEKTRNRESHSGQKSILQTCRNVRRKHAKGGKKRQQRNRHPPAGLCGILKWDYPGDNPRGVAK